MRTHRSYARFAVLALVAALAAGIVAGCGGGGGPSGTVQGRVVDRATGLGVSGTTVTVGTRSGISDINGLFSVTGITLGLQPLFVAPPPPWVAPDPDPSDPQIGDLNIIQGTTQLGNIIVVIQGPPAPP